MSVSTDKNFKTEPYVRQESAPELPAPSGAHGVLHWFHVNLFSSPLNIALTFLGGVFIYLIIPPLYSWGFDTAVFSAETSQACRGQGACWAFIDEKILQFIYGFYPEEHHWRPTLGIAILFAILAPVLFGKRKVQTISLLLLIFVYPFLAFWLFNGGFGLEVIETAKWGGLFLSLVISITGIIVSLPLGILLALGRQSKMPVVRLLSVVFIEVIRGVPLITILFMASQMLPLFLPEGTNFNKLLRAMVGVAIFASAYMAEVVRGGLAAVPRGQYEGSEALGLGYWQMMIFVILPQALKISIPSIVNTFIGLTKDTTLVSIIGLLDLLLITQTASRDSNWIGTEIEGYVFAALIYWIICFGMSRYSIYLENKLHTGHKR